MLLESNCEVTDEDEERSESEDLMQMEITEEFDDDLIEYIKEKRKELKGRDFANNVVILKQKVEDMKLIDGEGNSLPWIETMVITATEPLVVPNVNDDLKREVAIYKQTISNFEKAVAKFVEIGVKFQRPKDYYAEMVKSDEHMNNIKKVLLSEKKQKEDREKRLKNIQMRLYAKKVQANAIAKKQKKKAEDLAVIKRWKKISSKKNDSNSKFPSELLDPNNPERRKLLSKATYKELLPLKSKKRVSKDLKYGQKGRREPKKSSHRKKSN